MFVCYGNIVLHVNSLVSKDILCSVITAGTELFIYMCTQTGPFVVEVFQQGLNLIFKLRTADQLRENLINFLINIYGELVECCR